MLHYSIIFGKGDLRLRNSCSLYFNLLYSIDTIYLTFKDYCGLLSIFAVTCQRKSFVAPSTARVARDPTRRNTSVFAAKRRIPHTCPCIALSFVKDAQQTTAASAERTCGSACNAVTSLAEDWAKGTGTPSSTSCHLSRKI